MSSLSIFLIFIPVLGIILLGVNLLFAPHSPYEEKNSAFECGFHSFLGQNRTQFSISFFIFALLFLLFDLEILLVYPYAISNYINDVYGLIIMLLFFLLLTLGFVFELGKNALKIDSKQMIVINKKEASFFNKVNDSNRSDFYSLLSIILCIIFTNLLKLLEDSNIRKNIVKTIVDFGYIVFSTFLFWVKLLPINIWSYMFFLIIIIYLIGFLMLGSYIICFYIFPEYTATLLKDTTICYMNNTNRQNHPIPEFKDVSNINLSGRYYDNPLSSYPEYKNNGDSNVLLEIKKSLQDEKTFRWQRTQFRWPEMYATQLRNITRLYEQQHYNPYCTHWQWDDLRESMRSIPRYRDLAQVDYDRDVNIVIESEKRIQAIDQKLSEMNSNMNIDSDNSGNNSDGSSNSASTITAIVKNKSSNVQNNNNNNIDDTSDRMDID